MVNIPKIPGGYIILARRVFSHELMDKPPLYFKLWAWMLYKANWKDRDKLKRGQFVVTIDEMREAMSYMIGYRKAKPSKDAIRRAYEAFSKAQMITTRKTTRGMVITICNYDSYQNPSSYESRNEISCEGGEKPDFSPHDTREFEECKAMEKTKFEKSTNKKPLSQALIQNYGKGFPDRSDEW